MAKDGNPKYRKTWTTRSHFNGNSQVTVLSAQSIRRLCVPDDRDNYYGFPRWGDGAFFLRRKPLIDPFVERGVANGRSYGLSACTYDCRISHNLTIPRGKSALAATIERFDFPPEICGSVLDKSSWARVFVSAFNTHLDPGWNGWLTVELTNLSDRTVFFETGDPLVQIKFEWLDRATDLPYRGKYNDQGQDPQPVILEKS